MIERLEVTPGPGTVIRYGGIVAWADASASPALISFLTQSARNLSPSPRGGRQIADHIASVLATRDPEPHVAFAVIGPSDHGWASLLHGPVQAWDGARWLAPTPTPGWLQAIITPRPAITVSAAGTPTPAPEPDAMWDLEAGVVPGSGFLLVPSGVPGRYAVVRPPVDDHVEYQRDVMVPDAPVGPAVESGPQPPAEPIVAMTTALPAVEPTQTLGSLAAGTEAGASGLDPDGATTAGSESQAAGDDTAGAAAAGLAAAGLAAAGLAAAGLAAAAGVASETAAGSETDAAGDDPAGSEEEAAGDYSAGSEREAAGDDSAGRGTGATGAGPEAAGLGVAGGVAAAAAAMAGVAGAAARRNEHEDEPPAGDSEVKPGVTAAIAGTGTAVPGGGGQETAGAGEPAADAEDRPDVPAEPEVSPTAPVLAPTAEHAPVEPETAATTAEGTGPAQAREAGAPSVEPAAAAVAEEGLQPDRTATGAAGAAPAVTPEPMPELMVSAAAPRGADHDSPASDAVDEPDLPAIPGASSESADAGIEPRASVATAAAGRVAADGDSAVSDGRSAGDAGATAQDAAPEPTTGLEPDLAPLPATHRPPVPGPAGSVDLRTVATTAGPPLAKGGGPDQRIPGAPVVAGALCARGHLNRPGLTICARCRTPLRAGSDQVSGTRPPLGVLVGDDGIVYRLDRAYLVGSDPGRDPTVGGGLARPLTLRGSDVSGSHAELRLADWDVLVVDRGSAAGTCVYEPGASEWARLNPFEPRALPPGTHVAFGQRVLTFLSPWVTQS